MGILLYANALQGAVGSGYPSVHCRAAGGSQYTAYAKTPSAPKTHFNGALCLTSIDLCTGKHDRDACFGEDDISWKMHVPGV